MDFDWLQNRKFQKLFCTTQSILLNSGTVSHLDIAKDYNILPPIK